MFQLSTWPPLASLQQQRLKGGALLLLGMNICLPYSSMVLLGEGGRLFFPTQPLLVGVRVEPQCLLCHLAGEEQLLSKFFFILIFFVFRKGLDFLFLDLWLERMGFCWGLFHLHPLAFPGCQFHHTVPGIPSFLASLPCSLHLSECISLLGLP